MQLNSRMGVRAKLLVLAGLLAPKNRYDALVLGEFALQYAPILRFVAALTRSVFIVDWFVGLHETRVVDPGNSPRGVKPALYRAADKFAARFAHVLLTDTFPRAKMLDSLRSRADATLVLPVGSPEWAQPTRQALERRPLKLLYYGNYVPLHGIDVILAALASCRDAGHRLQLTLVGNSPRRAAAEFLVESLGLQRVCQFLDAVPEPDLAPVIAEHDVVLGIFGTSEKAATVIANKVWQGLSSGRPVVTRESAALALLRPVTGDALIEIRMDESPTEALVEVLATLDREGLPKPSVDISTQLEALVEAAFDDVLRNVAQKIDQHEAFSTGRRKACRKR
ncbi:hypothetical protein DEJ23_06350 [Curtobacterium sp. MCSS17_008]|nr:hypothetical protein DEJ23_06350 [Curtobacterium sp. MCSS17_008]